MKTKQHFATFTCSGKRVTVLVHQDERETRLLLSPRAWKVICEKLDVERGQTVVIG